MSQFCAGGLHEKFSEVTVFCLCHAKLIFLVKLLNSVLLNLSVEISQIQTCLNLKVVVAQGILGEFQLYVMH